MDETCDFVDELLKHNADPKKVDRSGETPAHLVIGTLDFRVMSKFIDYLGRESLTLQDESGNTLFHYAVGCLDATSIYKMVMKGANLVSKKKKLLEREKKYCDPFPLVQNLSLWTTPPFVGNPLWHLSFKKSGFFFFFFEIVSVQQ